MGRQGEIISYKMQDYRNRDPVDFDHVDNVIFPRNRGCGVYLTLSFCI